jgi:hypothetical protein
MKKKNRIDGFNVEVLESVRDGRVWFTARIVDLNICGTSSATSEKAFSTLSLKWELVKAAYQKSNLPVPKPLRSQGNKRNLAKLRKLASQPFPNSII